VSWVYVFNEGVLGALMQLMVQFKVQRLEQLLEQLIGQLVLKLMTPVTVLLLRLPPWPRLSFSLWRKRLLWWCCVMSRPMVVGLALTVAGVNSQPLAAPPSNALAFNNSGTPETVIASGTPTVADLQVVDCLLPGQVRRLGQSRYITARRPILTTAALCRLRGGEYTEYDRADYRSALAVWMPAAQAGDAQAQTNVGEIFERGLGGSPNYEAAFIWYQKAAVQGDARAQFNLGTLYERGLGVPTDKLQALNWYRKAWGMPADTLFYQQAAEAIYSEQRAQLESTIANKNKQITVLEQQVERLEQTLAQAQAAVATVPQEQTSSVRVTADLQAQVEQLQIMIAGLVSEQQTAQSAMAALPQLREPNTSDAETNALEPARDSSDSATTEQFGRYYALIIGNSDYEHLDDLQTPLHDTERVAQLLSQRYGFSTLQLRNSADITVLTALNDLADILGPNDNLLIYYAGHGSRVATDIEQAGYWLPVNADPPPRDTHWIANEAITRHLGRLQAKRILVVADSCYSGLLANTPDYLFLPGASNNQSPAYLQYKLAKGSRLLMASGGDFPVLDNGGQGHSVFAKAFIDILASNDQLLTGPQLFAKLKPRVEQASQQAGFQQVPIFRTIKVTGNEAGDFFFVPQQ